MKSIMDVINFLLDLGPSILMPIIIFVISLLFRVNIGKAVRGALTVGMGFIAINLVINLMVETLGPASKGMVENLRINLSVMDTGWPSAAAIAFSATNILPWIFGLGILLNIGLIVVKFTKTLNVDMWNYWQFIFGAAFVYAATGSFALSIIIGLLSILITLKLADRTAPLVQNYFKIPGVSLPHMQTVAWAPIGMLINKLLDRIPRLNKLDADPEKIQQRFGVLGEPLMIGTVLGAVIGILAYYPLLIQGQIKEAIAQILTTAVTLGAVMLIFPRMVRLLMEGLMPLSEGARSFLNKRFPGRELHIGLDVATVIGNPANIATGLLLVPITLVLAVLLNIIGVNKVLPFTDLAVIPFFSVWAIAWSRGNIIRGVIIFMAGILLIGTFLAPMTTELAIAANFNIPEGAGQISSLGGGSFLLPWLLMLPFVIGSIGGGSAGLYVSIAILVAITLVAYVFFFIKQPKAAAINEKSHVEKAEV